MNNKGFTLVELLAVLVIVASLATIAVVSVNPTINNVKGNYYKTLESNLKISAASYFDDNRTKKPNKDNLCSCIKIVENINEEEENCFKVTEVEYKKYFDKILDSDGKRTCTNTKIYIKRTSNGTYDYLPILNCKDYKTINSNENNYINDYCSLKNNQNFNNESFNITLLNENSTTSYPIITNEKDSVWIDKNISAKIIYKESCNELKLFKDSILYNSNTNNEINVLLTESGTYYIKAYDNGGNILATGKFIVNIDKNKPKFDILYKESFELEGSKYDYVNSLINIEEESGINKVNWKLYSSYNGGYRLIDSLETSSINYRNNGLTSDKYRLEISAIDNANNTSDKKIIEFYIYRTIQLVDEENTNLIYDNKFPVIDGFNMNSIKELPVPEKQGSVFIGWYDSNGRLIQNHSVSDELITKLYARWS